MSLINRNDKPEVPRVEVQGEEVVINRPDRQPDEQPEQHQKLPKTKWWF
jgi:protein tyrosine phosphatase (PTP) superfamily phosphohydrolase (DUF442 family)